MPSRTGERVVAPDATVEKLAGGFAFTEGPTCDPDGNVLFTDQPNDRILKWSTEGRLSTFLLPARPRTGSTCTFCPPIARRVVRVVTDLKKPNGIIGTPDGRSLFVSDIEANQTYRYDIALDGSPSGKILVVEQGSDGMTLGDEGHLYLTGDGVMVLDSHGRQIDHVRIPDEKWTANVAFGGKERRTLFITASTGLYGMRMRVRSANAAK